MSLLSTPYLNDIENTLKEQRVDLVVEKDFNQKHYLKCESCLWTTAYTDVSGYLDIRGTRVDCPVCKKGVIEVIETSFGQSQGYAPPSYLDFVLTDW